MSRAAAAAAVKTMSREHLKRVISGEAKEFLPAVIIDVREPEEVAMGMIPSAVSLPLQTVPGILSLDPENLAQALQLDGSDDFEPDETHFIFYCRSGARSGAAANAALKMDFENVYNYEGSWLDWAANNEEIVFPEA
eukprot:INCI2957.3.p1 GENE.INCI2957.3~~INCI2957.3.p1  ORF type:complete len:137 (+),score=28.63 INCI2957.3:218-628(+)